MQFCCVIFPSSNYYKVSLMATKDTKALMATKDTNNSESIGNGFLL